MIHLRAMLVGLCAVWLLVGCASSGGGEFRPAGARSQSTPSPRPNTGLAAAKDSQSKNPSTPLSKRQPRPLKVSLTPFKAGRPVDFPGISADVRQFGAEAAARFLTLHLQNGLQSSGKWSEVSIESGRQADDALLVSGEILKSGANTLSVRVQAQDRAGNTRLDKDYSVSSIARKYVHMKIPRQDALRDVIAKRITRDLSALASSLDVADVDSMGKMGGGEAHALSADRAIALQAIEARLFAAEKALHQARADYAEISSRGTLSADEDVGFRGFLAQLQSQLAASCMKFRRAGGRTQAHEIYCEAVFARALAVQTETKNMKHPGSGQDSEKQAGARRAESGKERGSVSTALITARQTWKESVPSPFARRPLQPAPESPDASNGLQRQSGSSVAHSVGPRSAKPQSQGPYAGIPADIPDGQDDDVVARQLREAAMAEGDADLQAQLWNEYRKYKRGSG